MKTLSLIAAAFLSSILMADVSNADLKAIRQLVTEGKYEEALQQHLWFHQESKGSPGMAGVRLSFALSQWAELGQKYPKALEALKNVRDENERKLLNGTGGFAEFHECFAINRTLKEGGKTYELFKQLDAKYPDVAQRCFDVATDPIFERKDYALYGKYVGDPLKRYDRIQQLRETNLGLMKKSSALDNDAFRRNADKTFTDKTAQLIKALAELKRLDEAREIQKRALAYFPNSEIEGSRPSP